jgi:hypothetical protein
MMAIRSIVAANQFESAKKALGTGRPATALRPILAIPTSGTVDKGRLGDRLPSGEDFRGVGLSSVARVLQEGQDLKGASRSPWPGFGLRRYLPSPQSSVASRVSAGAAGFFD